MPKLLLVLKLLLKDEKFIGKMIKQDISQGFPEEQNQQETHRYIRDLL